MPVQKNGNGGGAWLVSNPSSFTFYRYCPFAVTSTCYADASAVSDTHRPPASAADELAKISTNVSARGSKSPRSIAAAMSQRLSWSRRFAPCSALQHAGPLHFILSGDDGGRGATRPLSRFGGCVPCAVSHVWAFQCCKTAAAVHRQKIAPPTFLSRQKTTPPTLPAHNRTPPPPPPPFPLPRPNAKERKSRKENSSSQLNCAGSARQRPPV